MKEYKIEVKRTTIHHVIQKAPTEEEALKKIKYRFLAAKWAMEGLKPGDDELFWDDFEFAVIE